jgi:hypothetical protein
MITVLLKREMGFTLANIPDSIFRFARGNVSEVARGLMFDIMDGTTFLSLKTALETYFHRHIHHVTNGNVIETDVSTDPLRPQQATATPAPEAVQTQTRCGACDRPIDECECERCPDCEQLIANCTCEREEVAFRDVIANGSNTESLKNLSKLDRIEMTNLKPLIASKLNNDIAGKAKMLTDKYIIYNRLLAQMMQLQREIERLSTLVGADPIVDDMVTKINKLKDNPDNMVKDIYFTQNYLVIETDEIITNPMSDGKKRRIGEMEFYIRLDSLLGTSSGENIPIIIRNCTREDNNHAQECGHVSNTGSPCFGTWTEPLLKSVFDKDLEQLIDILVRFVRTPNEGDVMGRPILNWPIVEEN